MPQAAEPDLTALYLEQELRVARMRAELAEQRLTRARRSLELRERELAAYRAHGTLPKGKRYQSEMAYERKRQARTAAQLSGDPPPFRSQRPTAKA